MDELCSISDSMQYLLARQMWIVAQNVLNRVTSCKLIEHQFHGDTRALDCRSSTLPLGISNDPRCDLCVSHICPQNHAIGCR